MPPPRGAVEATGDEARPRIDPGRELRRVVLRDEPIEGDLAEVGIGQLGVAVGHRQLRRLDAEMDPARIGDPSRTERGGRRRLEPLEDVDDLERDRPRRIRRMAGDPDAPVLGGDRVAPRRRVPGEVGGGQRRPGGREAARLPRGDVARVEVVESCIGQPFERARERGQPNHLARPPRPAMRPEDLGEPGTRPHRRLDPGRRDLDAADESVPCREAAPGQVDGRSEDLRSREPPEPGVGVGPRADRARDGDRQRPMEREAFEPASSQGGRVGGSSRSSRAIERVLAAFGGVPDEPERIAADAAEQRPDDGQRGVRGDGRIDRGPTRPQDSETGLRREVVRRDDGPARSPSDARRNEDRTGHGVASTSSNEAGSDGPPT